jgi:hypothetical protein
MTSVPAWRVARLHVDDSIDAVFMPIPASVAATHNLGCSIFEEVDAQQCQDPVSVR